MTFSLAATLVGSVLLFVGALFILIAAIGVLRFDDLLKRLHAAAKPQTFGTMMLMAGLALTLRAPSTIWALALVVAFTLVTSPISAHLAARAGFRTGHAPTRTLIVDEYRRDKRRALRAVAQRAAEEEMRHD